MGVMMVETLLVLWLLRGVLYGRMSSDVLIIETVGSAFIFLDSLSQRGFSVSCWVRGTVGGGCDRGCLRFMDCHSWLYSRRPSCPPRLINSHPRSKHDASTNF